MWRHSIDYLQSYDGPYAGDEMNDLLSSALLGLGNTVIERGMHLPGTFGGELVLGKTTSRRA